MTFSGCLTWLTIFNAFRNKFVRITISERFHFTSLHSFSMDANGPPESEKQRRIRFSPDEDQLLRDLVAQYGENHWERVSSSFPTRTMRQCRDRYVKYLAPDLVFNKWTEPEDRLLDQKFAEFGPHWKHLATFFPNRTDVGLKNRWQIHRRNQQKKFLSIITQRAKAWPFERKYETAAERPVPVPMADPQREPEARDEFEGKSEEVDFLNLEANCFDEDFLFFASDIDF
jgi:hypothetical protein